MEGTCPTLRPPAELSYNVSTTRVGSTDARLPNQRWQNDAVTALSILVVLLLAIPSQLVFAPLGAAGSPAQLMGLGLLLWWVVMHIIWGWQGAHPLGWITIGGLTLLIATLASYVAASVRPIGSVELLAADRGLLSVVAWLGIMFVAADGITTRGRLNTLLRRISVAGGLLALLGLAQFATGQSFVDGISIPGLTPNQDVTGFIERAGFTRPAGTAIHPIEYGGVLTLILPLSLHYAILDRGRRGIRAWWPAAAMGCSLALSLSRSAIISAVVVFAVVLPTWEKHVRRLFYAFLGALVLVVYIAVPGMLGAVGSLFTGIASDGSTLSRTDSFSLAGDFIARSPFFGRGLSTFLPSYRILDNQYLLALVEIGVFGLVALLSVFTASIITSRRVERLSFDSQTRSLARSLTASVCACAVGFATFDAFSFPMVPTLLFLLIGSTAALARLSSTNTASHSPVSLLRIRPSGRISQEPTSRED